MQKYFVIFVLFLIVLPGCNRSYTPKPRGYLRIDFKEKEYTQFDSTCPYRFEYPVYAQIVMDMKARTEPCWLNIEFPAYNGTIHISYKEVRGDLDKFVEDSRNLAYKHTIKADAIRETVYSDTGRNVHGILYDIKGNAASNLQFFLTDSIAHFLRGSLYFNVTPDKDSLAPVINYFKEDIVHLIETFNWK